MNTIEPQPDATSSAYKPMLALLLMMGGFLLARRGLLLDPALTLGICIVLLVMWFELRAARARWIAGLLSTVVLAVCGVLLSGVWCMTVETHTAANDITKWVSPNAEIWKIEGNIRTIPQVRTRAGGALGQFSYQGPVTYFRLNVDHMIDRHDTKIPCRGFVLVRVDDAVYDWSVGDRLQMTGMMRSFQKPMNPGEIDRSLLARSEGLAGMLLVPSQDAITLVNSEQAENNILWKARRFQATIRNRASGWLLQDIPVSNSTTREGLLAALILGDRGPRLDGIDQSFKRIGLSHLLSVSGLHLAVFLFVALFVVRLTSPPPVVERLIVVLLVLLYVVAIPARIPVWRAAIMVLAWVFADSTGRRFAPINILSFAAMVLLLWKPSEVESPGFQLSFGIVLALILLTTPMRLRLFGAPPESEFLTTAETIFEWIKKTIAATLVAWLISMPMIAFHFGVLCPLAPVATIAATPLVLIILGAGYIKTISAVFFPSLGIILAPFLVVATDGLSGLILRIDALPLASISVPYPNAFWTLSATAVIWWWVAIRLEGKRRWLRRSIIILLAVLFANNMIFPQQLPDTQTSRVGSITMLAVGNGSCYILESDREVILFDVGSGNHYGIGDTTIVPALRTLGILNVPTIILSHGDIDHFSGIIEVMNTMETKRLIVPTHLLDKLSNEPFGSVAWMLNEVEHMGIEILGVQHGFEYTVGNAHMRWISPPSDVTFDSENDRSSVIHISIGDRRILLTGDIQKDAISWLLDNETVDSLHADILELPHHGSWSDTAATFVEIVNPDIVLQSTGPTRLYNDRWQIPLLGRRRFMTPVHGATTITIHEDGSLEAKTFVNEPAR